MSSWLDYTVNGMIIGNIYALLAVGLALIFGVSRLINFAHGSVYLVGAYVGWVAVMQLRHAAARHHLSWSRSARCSALIIERFGLRPLQDSARIAPLLATIGISFVLDQLVQLTFSPDPRALPSQLPDIALPDRQRHDRRARPADRRHRPEQRRRCCTSSCATRSSAGRCARRPRTATPRSRWASTSTRVQPGRVRHRRRRLAACPACWSACTTTSIDPAMSFQATLKGVVAQVVGGVGNVPGAIVGSLLLGLVESYGIALFGTSYRNLFAFILLVVVLVLRPNGLFASAPADAARADDRHLHRAQPPDAISRPGRCSVVAGLAALLPLVFPASLCAADADQRLALRHAGLSLTLVAGTVGQVSLGHAALLAIGGYTSALLSLDFGVPVGLAILSAGLMTAALGTAPDLPVVPPARPLRLDRDAGDRRDRIAGDPELGERDARPDRRLRHPAAVAVRLRARQPTARSTGSPCA